MPCVRRLGENARKAKAAPSKHRTHVNSVAFLWVAKCGVKGLALMNGTAKLCRNKETELFLYCMYPCYFSCNVWFQKISIPPPPPTDGQWKFLGGGGGGLKGRNFQGVGHLKNFQEA